MIVVVALVLAGLAVLGAVVALAMGRGGELTSARPDHPPLPPPGEGAFHGPVPFRIPRGLFGYQVELTDEAMRRLRYALYEREARVAALEEQLDVVRRRLAASDPPDPPDPPELPDSPDSRDPRDSHYPPPTPWAAPDLTPVDLAKNNGPAGDAEEARP